MKRRGSSGVPLPDIYTALAARGAKPARGGLTLVVGPASAGKSLLLFNLLVGYARHELPSLAFLLDTNELDAATRFAAILCAERYADVKQGIMEGEDRYAEKIQDYLPDLQVQFHAPEFAGVQLQVDAFGQRYGQPPDVLVLDNLGNQTSGLDNEYALLKALTLELDQLAKVEQCAVIAAHHTTDLVNEEPAARDKVLGKISQYAALMLSVNYSAETQEYKVAVVKSREGASDMAARHPITMWADPARVALTDNEQVFRSWSNRSMLAPDLRVAAQHEYPELRPNVFRGNFGGMHA
jgi:hypothetical protein